MKNFTGQTVSPKFKVFQLIAEILETISDTFTFTQIFIFLIVTGMAIAVFLPILFK